jgi:aspartate/methionine/tyrosine aminotransferase
VTVTLDRLTPDELLTLSGELNDEYGRFREAGLALDLTRGKPSRSQLALSDSLDTGDAAEGGFLAADGSDTRNYGGLDGLPEARELGADLLGVRPDEVMAGGNSSLTLMYLYLLNAWLYGPAGQGSAWRDSGTTKFLCPVPGYDRHFAILEDLGIEMLNVRMTADGPDMDQVESLVRDDPTVKGLWCVPKYSNPGGETYSDATVQRLGRLGTIAGPHFRIMWDNAYAVHDLDDTPPQLDNIMDACRAQGTDDSVMLFASTSKVTRAGAGIAFTAGSPVNLTAFRARLQTLTIGPDKVNQLRHVRFLRDLDGVRDHMQQHAAILRPKFDLVQRRLSEALEGKGMGSWSAPRGGYFVSFDSLPGLASRIINLAEDAGVKLTPAGATFPYRRDPDDSNIRLAPTFPDLSDLDQAMRVFTVCVQLASVTQRLAD